MALSPGIYTPIYVITKAMKDAGLLRKGSTANSYDITDGLERLNELVLYASTKGLKLWLNQLLTVPLQVGKQTYTLMPSGDISITKPSRIIEGYFLDSTQNQRPLISLSWDDWNKLSNKTQMGQINSYFQDKQSSVINLSFWLTPDVTAVTGTCVMLIQQQQPTSTNLETGMVFPPEWGMWLHWALADQIATGQPQSIMDRCEKRAMQTFEDLNNWDVEDASTSFAPDSRTSNVFGKNS